MSLAVARLPFPVDEAKLAPPVTRPGSVDKAGVIARLLGSTTPFATIVAPAGYGKSTLLSRWANLDPRPFAWVQVDDRDDDSIVFLRSIAAAVDRVHPIAAAQIEALVGPGGSIWSRVPFIGNALAALTAPLVLAIDDVHALTNPECLSVLASLFAYVPPGSQVVVTGRAEPALPIARWRAQGMLEEVDASDLRLDDQEAATLLRGADVVLAGEEVAELNQRTEGWAAGIYLAALSMRGGAAARDTRVERFSGHNKMVSAYFRLEILSRLGAQEAQFLVRTSVLESMSGPLCDVVLEADDSAAMLESLERSNRFVVPLDQHGAWYRYHHLFRELLRNELDRSDPRAARDINRRAMRWCLTNDQREAALRYAHAAGEWEVLAGLIDELGLATHYDGRMQTLEEWLSWFSDADLRRFPALAVYAGWVRAMTGRAAEAERYLAIADGAVSDIPLADGSLTIQPWVATLRSATMQDGAEQARSDADLAMDLLPADSQWRSDALVMRGISSAVLGEPDLARADLRLAFAEAEALGAIDNLFLAQGELALLEAAQGEWSQAARHAELSRRLVDQARLTHYSMAAITHVAVARVALHDRRPDDARFAMTMAHRLRPMLDLGMPWLTVQVGNELVRAHLALGEAEAARGVLAETLAFIDRAPDLAALADETRSLGERVTALAGDGIWAVHLTGAELRLLPYLSTHLTFPEIADRLFVTSHTVRTQAKSIYSKLDASSRGEAVDRAVDVGLLEPMFTHRSSVAS